MLIISNCLSDIADEGCLKVAASLTKRLKSAPNCKVITYDRTSKLSDIHLNINKFMINHRLCRLLREQSDVLYIPFPARPISTAIRVFNLSLFCKGTLRVILTQKSRISILARLLYKLSRARFCFFSKDAAEFFSDIVGKRVEYLKTGVDTKRFIPVDEETIASLKKKYGFDKDKKLVLHVGHLKEGRNIGMLTRIDDRYQVLLVVSTLTKDEQDLQLKNRLLARPNIRIIEDYIPNIEEIYQMADVYFFPVVDSGNCIDVPLSCMEAAACGKPVVTTDFGEMHELIDKEGFYLLEGFDKENINKLIKTAIDNSNKADTRKSVLCYDWDNAINTLSYI